MCYLSAGLVFLFAINNYMRLKNLKVSKSVQSGIGQKSDVDWFGPLLHHCSAIVVVPYY
jgi:hypothetical protein